MKTCTTCKTSKEYSEFYKNKNAPDGHTYPCKECCKKSRKQYYQKLDSLRGLL